MLLAKLIPKYCNNCFYYFIYSANELDVLTLGDESAKGLGLNVSDKVILMLAAALAGVSVSIAGLLSFVGY